MFDGQSRCEVSTKFEKSKPRAASCRKGEPSLAPPLRYRQQSIHTSMLGTFLIFWRRLLPARGRLGGMMTCWVGLLALRMYQKIGSQEQDLAFGAHQRLKSR